MTPSLVNTSFHFPQLGLIFVALLLGMRHGLDLDHLAIIDALTRRLPPQSRLAHFVGLFFSIGHGLVIIVFCVLINYFFRNFMLPDWLDRMMLALSIVFLLIFGILNLSSLFNKDAQQKPLILQKYHKFISVRPLSIMAIGAVFAISFDTVSQIALFSLNFSHFLNRFFPILLGLSFMFGMIITDGFNGLIVTSLIRKATTLSMRLSKAFTLGIGLFSTAIGIYEVVNML